MDKKTFIHLLTARSKGLSRQEREQHEQEHLMWNRRAFLKATGLTTFGLATTLGGEQVMAAPGGFLSMLQSVAGDTDRILVLIQLKGGNDGLNTVIDRRNDEYYRIRPSLGVQESGLWALSNEIGMPLSTEPLRGLWDAGQMKVVHNVGYPNPNYSHFRSTDIWSTASGSDETWNTGWIGRMIEAEFPAFLEAQPTTPPAIQIGVQANLVFRSNDFTTALAMSSPEEFYRLAQSGNLFELDHLGPEPNDRELAFVRQTANSAFRYSQTIRDAYLRGRVEGSYPDHSLGRQLEIVAKLIRGGLGTKVYLVSIDGFDTHADQLNYHPYLLQTLSDSVSAFYSDLNKAGRGKQVLSMTFSEFGRTIYENASQGTDHGTGAPMLLFGGDIGQGFLGSPPDLVNTDQYGDPYFDIDFKDIYQTVIEDWFGIDPRLAEFMMGRRNQRFNGLLPPFVTPKGANAHIVLLGHRPRPGVRPLIDIQYALLRPGVLKLEVLDQSGQVLRRVEDSFREAGAYTYVLDPRAMALRPGSYLYRVKTGGKVYSRPLTIF